MGLRREFRYGVTTADEGLRPIYHQNSNILLICLIDGFTQTRKLSSLLSCLFDQHAITAKHNHPRTARLYGLSESELWHVRSRWVLRLKCGNITKAAHTALCAHVTTVCKRGGHPRLPASRNLGISATLIERCQDPTVLYVLPPQS